MTDHTRGWRSFEGDGSDDGTSTLFRWPMGWPPRCDLTGTATDLMDGWMGRYMAWGARRCIRLPCTYKMALPSPRATLSRERCLPRPLIDVVNLACLFPRGSPSPSVFSPACRSNRFCWRSHRQEVLPTPHLRHHQPARVNRQHGTSQVPRPVRAATLPARVRHRDHGFPALRI